MKKILLLFVLMTMTLVLVAQNYSPCYTNNMAKGDEAFKQGKYSEAKAFYSTAKQCPNGNSTEVQNKIDVCETRIEAQLKEAEKESEKESAVKIRHTGKVKVSNVTAVQIGKEIHVSYDLERKSDITLFLSVDGGKTYQLLNQVRGDVGENVLAGHKTIVWDVLAEREQLKGDDIMFKVKAQGGDDLELTIKGVTFKMMYVQGGIFTMGDSQSYSYRERHNVGLNNFYMGETEVTQALWQAVMSNNPSRYKGEDLPVTNVSWYDCQSFVKKLNELSGLNFRLPTEAEWEYAARGGQKSQGYKYSGSDSINEVAWYNRNSGDLYIDKWKKNWRARDKQQDDNHLRPHSVKEKRPNELGLYDMAGNVEEWCSDWYGEYDDFTRINPKGPSSGESRVIRGGNWRFSESNCLTTRRGDNDPKYGFSTQSFRLLCDMPTEQESLVGDILFNVIVQEGDILEFTANAVKFNMIHVEGGTFIMGCTIEQGSDCSNSAKPAHSVTVSDFYMGETEVTQDLWLAIMKTSVKDQVDKIPDWNYFYGVGKDFPIYYVSYTEALGFCNKLNDLLRDKLPAGYRFALPYEAQWEFAARGGVKSRGCKYSGSDTIDVVAWHHDKVNSWKDKARPVKTKAPNELGIYDMSGNVWEWCMDWYGEYSSSSQENPIGPASGSWRVLRGGSYDGDSCQLSVRKSGPPDDRHWNFFHYYGFRLALVKQ